jgi:hypothetical protein
VCGTVTLPAGYATARVYLGAFQTPIIQRRPVSWTIVEVGVGETTRYCLPEVTPGLWFIRAVAAADSADPEPWTRRSLLLGGDDPVTVTDKSTSVVGIALRVRRMTDLPVLYAVPELESQNLAYPAQEEPGCPDGRRLAAGLAPSRSERWR